MVFLEYMLVVFVFLCVFSWAETNSNLFFEKIISLFSFLTKSEQKKKAWQNRVAFKKIYLKRKNPGLKFKLLNKVLTIGSFATILSFLRDLFHHEDLQDKLKQFFSSLHLIWCCTCYKFLDTGWELFGYTAHGFTFKQKMFKPAR